MIKINKAKDTLLTPNQFTLTLKSIMVGIEIMSIPNFVMKVSKQDAWISILLGAVYPIYLVIIANFLCKKFPKDNILVLSKKCFGNFLGSILNFIFISFFLLSLTAELAGYSNVFRVYAVTFLKNYQVLLTVLIPIAFVSYKGIKTLGRINEVGFYLTICLIIFPVGILAYGSFLNLMPVFGSGFKNIVKGSTYTGFAYSGMEIIFLIYPFLQDRKKLLKCGFVNTAIVTFIYVWVTFGTIFYLGVDSSQKYLWPVITLADSIKVPVINSFRYIFVTLFSLVEFKCISTYYFAVSYGLNQSIKKVSAKTFTILLYPIIIIISMLYGNPTNCRYYVNNLAPVYIIFNLIYVSIVAALIYFKRGGNYKKT